MKIQIVDVYEDAAFQRLSNLGVNMPAMIAKSLTNVAFKVRAAEYAEMQKVFRSPVPYTLNSLFVRAAEKSRTPIAAEVWFKDPRRGAHYLAAEVYGGNRSRKGFDMQLQAAGLMPRGWVSVPGKRVQLDEYGNVPRGLYQKIMSELRIQNDPSANSTAKSRKRRNQKITRFFVSNGKGTMRGLRLGIWEHEPGSSTAKYARNVNLLFAFVSHARYPVRLNFERVGRAVWAVEFPKEIRLRYLEKMDS